MPSGLLLEQLARARDLGFLGRTAVETQLGHARALIAALPSEDGGGSVSLLDLGSGGGLPGLVAACDPKFSEVVLLDRSERRCAFLRSSLVALPAAGRVHVIVGLAEERGREVLLREVFDLVTSRSFGPPAATLECGSAFLRVGGHLLVSDPPGGRVWPSDGARSFGLASQHVSTADPAWTLFRKIEPLDARFPRRAGVPAGRPLFHV